MKYVRPQLSQRLEPESKQQLLESYFEFYEKQFLENPEQLNQKISRDTFSSLLDEIGNLILQRSKEMASSPEVKKYLKATPLPASLASLLPEEFRVFCLALNSLKQWVSAEQGATDRFLLGGTGRQRCKSVADHCLVTGETLDPKTLELHHPVRDGRPPIPLSKKGHELVEQQHSGVAADADPIRQALAEFKKKGNRSWVMLRRGCHLLLDQPIPESTPSVIAGSKTFAKKAAALTNLSFQELVQWLDQNSLGEFK